MSTSTIRILLDKFKRSRGSWLDRALKWLWVAGTYVSLQLTEGNHTTAFPGAYLILWDDGSTSGVISTPFTTAFEMLKTANDATAESQRDSFAICRPETIVPV